MTEESRPAWFLKEHWVPLVLRRKLRQGTKHCGVKWLRKGCRTTETDAMGLLLVSTTVQGGCILGYEIEDNFSK